MLKNVFVAILLIFYFLFVFMCFKLCLWFLICFVMVFVFLKGFLMVFIVLNKRFLLFLIAFLLVFKKDSIDCL